MYAEIISIGDELTSGQRLDTNSQWLSRQLHDLGIRVLFHTTVGDDLSANVEVFRRAADRVDIVIATGGLGPTADDLTRDVLAKVSGTELELDEPSLEHIRSLFARRQRPMPERNVVQAYFPRGSRVISNPHGTAPGIEIDIPRADGRFCRVFALPGVPAEMREMWDGSVAPAVSKLTGNRRIIRHHCIRCFGVGESDLEAMLPDMIRRGRRPEVGITVSQATISLRITADGESESACFAAMTETIATIHNCLGDLVFGEGEDELQHAIARLLEQRQAKLSVAECGTSGMITQWLSELADHQRRFASGLVTEHPRMILTMLGVGETTDSSTADEHDVCLLADAVRQASQADIGLALGFVVRDQSGIDQRDSPISDSRPKVALANVPPSKVPSANAPSSDAPSLDAVIAIATNRGTKVYTTPYVGHPDVRKARVAKHALNLVRLMLKNDWHA